MTTSNSINTAVFTEISPNEFLDQKKLNTLHAIIDKISGGNPTVSLGIESLLVEKHRLPRFDHAFETLITGKNDTILRSVEAGFQTTINTICSASREKTKSYSQHETSLYLLTLQYLILTLDRWKFPKNTPNHYTPVLKLKLQTAYNLGRQLGLSEKDIRRQCFTTEFQQPYDPVLRSFLFLDEARLDNLISLLNKRDAANDPNFIHKIKSLSNISSATFQKDDKIESLIRFLQAKLKIKKLNLSEYEKHTNEIKKLIINMCEPDNYVQYYAIIDALKQNLETKHQLEIQTNLSIGDKGI